MITVLKDLMIISHRWFGVNYETSFFICNSTHYTKKKKTKYLLNQATFVNKKTHLTYQPDATSTNRTKLMCEPFSVEQLPVHFEILTLHRSELYTVEMQQQCGHTSLRILLEITEGGERAYLQRSSQQIKQQINKNLMIFLLLYSPQSGHQMT